MAWRPFAAECPELAALAEEWFGRDHAVLLGTLRRDGSPRISVVECDFAGGELVVGMIWRSVKALDLLRDPRVTVHSMPPGKDNPAGDLKLYGRAVEILDRGTKHAYENTLYDRLAWRPPEPYHAFAFEVASGGFVKFRDGGREVWRWRAGEPFQRTFLADTPGPA